MLYLYIAISALLSVISCILAGISLNLIWILPLSFISAFLSLIILHVLILGISVLFVDTKKDNAKHYPYYRILAQKTIDLIFSLLNIHLIAGGKEKIPDNTRFLLVSNHTYDFDPAFFMHYLPECDLGFIGKKEIYTDKVPIAKMMHKLNGLPIDRENNRNAVKTISKAADFIKTDISSMAIFPEGYVSLTGELLPFRSGAFKIAKKAECPIVVASISNTKSILKNIFRRRSNIYLDILSVISAEQVKELTTAQLSDMIYPMILEGMKKYEKTH